MAEILVAVVHLKAEMRIKVELKVVVQRLVLAMVAK
jgi:hypothetical protein